MKDRYMRMLAVVALVAVLLNIVMEPVAFAFERSGMSDRAKATMNEDRGQDDVSGGSLNDEFTINDFTKMLSKMPYFKEYDLEAVDEGNVSEILVKSGEKVVQKAKFVKQDDGVSMLKVEDEGGELVGTMALDTMSKTIKTVSADGEVLAVVDYSGLSDDGNGYVLFKDSQDKEMGMIKADDNKAEFLIGGKTQLVIAKKTRNPLYIGGVFEDVKNIRLDSSDKPFNVFFEKSGVAGTQMPKNYAEAIAMACMGAIAMAFVAIASGFVGLAGMLGDWAIVIAGFAVNIMNTIVRYEEEEKAAKEKKKTDSSDDGDQDDKAEDEAGDKESGSGTDDCGKPELGKSTYASYIDIGSAVCYQKFDLVGYDSWDGGYHPQMIYSLNSAAPGATIIDLVAFAEEVPASLDCAESNTLGEFGTELCDAANGDIDTVVNPPYAYTWSITIEGVTTPRVWYRGGYEGIFRHGFFWDGKNLFGTQMPTGRYDYVTKRQYKQHEYAGLTPLTVKGNVTIVNNEESPFGAGWWLAGLSRIYELRDGSMMYVDGAANEKVYEKAGENYTSPKGDYSRLVRQGTNAPNVYYTDNTIEVFQKFPEDGDNVYWIYIREEQNGVFTIYNYEKNSKNQRVLAGISKGNGITSLYTQFNYGLTGRLESVTNTAGSSGASTLSYDDGGNLLSIINPDGRGVYFEYDGHKIIKKDYVNDQFVEGEYTEYVHNEYGRISQVIHPDRRLVDTFYPKRFVGIVNSVPPDEGTSVENLVVPYPNKFAKDRVTRPDGEYQYKSNSGGDMTSVIDPHGRETKTEKNDDGYDVVIDYPNGLKVERDWWKGKRTVDRYKDAEGNVLLQNSYSYYDLGSVHESLIKLVSSQTGTLPAVTYSYYSDTKNLSDVTWLDMNTHYEYDSSYTSQPVSIRTEATGSAPAATIENTMDYNESGELMSISDGVATLTFSNYDAGRPGMVTDAAGYTSSFTYDPVGRYKSITDAKNNKSCFWYDEMGHLSDVTLPVDASVINCETQALSGAAPSYHFTFDAMDRPLSTTALNGSVFTFTYNGIGELQTTTNRNGITLNYSYDDAMLDRISAPDGTFIDFDYYDDSLEVSDVMTESSHIELEYDPLGRITKETIHPVGYEVYPYEPEPLSYEYNTNGQLVSGADKEYLYSETTGLLNRIREKDAPSWINYGYDGLYRVNSRSVYLFLKLYANKSMSFNAQGKMESLNLTGENSAVVRQMTYDYDNRGNISGITASGAVGAGAYAYAYDEMSQLESVSRDGVEVERYWYDGRGNISDTGSFETGAAKEIYDPVTNELTQDERCVYQYDNEGNMTVKDCRYNPYDLNMANAAPVKYEYDWNWRNQIVEARIFEGAPGTLKNKIQFGYDGLGRRIWRKKLNPNGVVMEIEGYVYNGGNALYDYDGISLSRKNTYMMSGIDNLYYVTRGTNHYYYHTDHLGSVVAITDEDGDIVNAYEYDAWGNFTVTCPSQAAGKPCIPNRYTYTGREWDNDLQMYYYRARWYDPNIQRFTSEDPEFNVNQFAYVGNHPIIMTDPEGENADVLKAGWTAAVIEPTGAGEVVMGIVTVGVIIAEVILKQKGWNNVKETSGKNTTTHQKGTGDRNKRKRDENKKNKPKSKQDIKDKQDKNKQKKQELQDKGGACYIE